MGRMTSLFAAIFGVVVISLMVVTLNNMLTMDGPEGNSFTVLKRLEAREEIKLCALKLLILLNQKHSPDMDTELKRFFRIKQNIQQFRQ